ncbi:dienelactone hydrolase family protein [Neptuniibacter sp. CAU 1671]|uniref:dienelactone hydrolase family protein n=1 Tax=Neptuniibacter sp. CAU 1671 TaxID=3032593 RepID=UPI0023DB228F|nr:dienelactone hydrolase family protein [Neptuniibacter sp. CAU 1671]MDF2182846.1 dienelactone hydrolase family protein [Neptuniibacter sp. CAU 1671]
MRIVHLAISLLFSPTLLAQTVDYTVDDAPYEGYYLTAGPEAPLVLLLHDWDGLTDYEIRRAQMLNNLGFSVFAADLFGKGVRPTEVKDRRQHTGELYQDRAKMRRLMLAALDKAGSMGANLSNAVGMGYCFGGAAVLELARSGAQLKGFASFHGGLDTPEGQNYQNTQGSIIIFHGTADSNISMQSFANLADALEQHHVPHEMITYSGAPHAFTVFETPRYRADADMKSWQRFTDYLQNLTKSTVQ